MKNRDNVRTTSDRISVHKTSARIKSEKGPKFNKISTKGLDKINSNNSMSLFAFIILVLFIISYSHFVRTGQLFNFSFKSLIDYLSGMPDITFTLSKVDLTIYADWGFFNFLRDFINIFSGLTEFSFQFSGMIGQAFIVIGYLVGLLFL